MPHRFVFAIALLGFAVAPVAAGAVSVTIDGQPVTGAVAKDGHLMVPFRAPLEAIGASVSWDDATNVASASYNGAQLVTVTIGSTAANVTGTTHTLSVAPVLQDHLAYIPVDALADISHASVTYSADRETATVTNWDLAGVNAVGGSAPLGVLWIWVWILVIGGIGYLIAAGVLSGRIATSR